MAKKGLKKRIDDDTIPQTPLEELTTILSVKHEMYGDFGAIAEKSQELKGCYYEQADNLNPAEQEALEMIFHKIARILFSKERKDSWMDIAGYSIRAIEAS